MKVGFIGYGHMAGAMAKGLVRSGYLEPIEISVCAKDYDRLCEKVEAELRDAVPLRTAAEVARESNIVFISVKPNQVEEVIKPIRDELVGRIVISVVFGMDFDGYEELFGGTTGIKHISIIPNTPCEVCRGITIMEDKHNLSDPELEIVKELLGKLGAIEFLPNDTMWLAGEVSSCGPAFAAMFIEALGDAGAKYGLDREAAYRIVSRMVAGTGTLQAETGKNPGIMVEEVATPGGVTIKGVTALREANFHEVVARAIDGIEEQKK